MFDNPLHYMYFSDYIREYVTPRWACVGSGWRPWARWTPATLCPGERCWRQVDGGGSAEITSWPVQELAGAKMQVLRRVEGSKVRGAAENGGWQYDSPATVLMTVLPQSWWQSCHRPDDSPDTVLMTVLTQSWWQSCLRSTCCWASRRWWGCSGRPWSATSLTEAKSRRPLLGEWKKWCKLKTFIKTKHCNWVDYLLGIRTKQSIELNMKHKNFINQK